MKRLKLNTFSRNNKFILVLGFIFFLTIIIVLWGVSYAAIAPFAPTNLQQSTSPASTPSSIYLTWDDNSDTETHFILEKKLSTDTVFVPITNAFIGKDFHFFNDQYVRTGFSYDYQIKACLTEKVDLISSTLNSPTISSTSGTSAGVETVCSDYAKFEGAIIKTSNTTDTINTTDATNTTNTTENINLYTPKDPSGLELNNISTPLKASIELKWVDNSDNETQFIIERRISDDLTSTATSYYTNAGINNYTDFQVYRGVSYYYRVKACHVGYSSNLCSGFTSVSMISIPSLNNITVSAPKNLVVENTSTATVASIGLKWEDYSNNETEFVIDRTSSIDGAKAINSYYLNSNETSYTDLEVTRGASYYYKVKACYTSTAVTTVGTTSKICSAYTELRGTSIPSTTPNVTAVSAPTGLKLYSTLDSLSKSIPLKWIDNSNNETKFIIERKLSNETTYSATAYGSTDKDVNYFTDNDARAGISYDYRVKASYTPTSGTTSGNIYSIYSGYTELKGISIPVVIPNIVAVASPANLKLYSALDSLSKSISLKWEDLSDNETEFTVERKLNSETTYSATAYGNTNKDVNYFTDYDAKPGVSYDYRVKACYTPPTGTITETIKTVCSNYADLEKITIPLPVTNIIQISDPTNLVLNNTSTNTTPSIKINWEDNSNNETNFIIERRLSSDSKSTVVIYSANSNATSFSDFNVTRGVPYYYRVKACYKQTTTTSSITCSGFTDLKTISIPALNIEENKDNIITTPLVSLIEQKEIIENPIKLIQNEISKVILPETTNEIITNIQDISFAVDELRNSIVNTKEQLINIINGSTLNVIKIIKENNLTIDILKVYLYRDELINKVEMSLLNLALVTPEDISNLKIEINKGIENLRGMAGGGGVVSQIDKVNSENINEAFNLLTVAVEDKSGVLKEQGGDLLYKDTNNDGISDYDSTYVYNIDPIKPSPVSSYEGRSINASEKILLGYNPKSPELVKVEIEQPEVSEAPVVPTYKVKDVKLTEQKEIIIKGQALPNSFITLYIYSTPIIVTIKADNNGEWEYLLDKELENGNHTVYTATVNNTGNIIAKSSGYLFTKTAEAVTFQDLPIAEASINVAKPGLMDGISLYLAGASVLLLILSIIILIGVITKKNSQTQN